MTTLADVGSTIENGPFIVFIAWAVTAVVFAWIGATFNGNQPVRHCGGCDECDQLAFEPFTDAEVDRAFEALRYHLARRRGES